MPPVQAIVTYPGVRQFESASITLAHGISPSASMLTIAPQLAPLPSRGDLTITFGAKRLRLPDCQIDSSATQYDQQGLAVSLRIEDRRWKWAFGSISGVYNRRLPDGTLDKGDGADVRDDTERTPQELATLLFEAMGEKGFDVKDLPNTTRPFVEWEGDNPAQELARLCDALGCHVTLTLKDSKAKIRKVGKGAKIPNGAVMTDSIEVDPASKPDNVVILCGPSISQVDFELEAVGLEGDGRVVPIDELSYKPAGGWSIADLQEFMGMMTVNGATLAGVAFTRASANRKLAMESVYRWFRVKVPVRLPGIGIAQQLSQILPLRQEQVQKQLVNKVWRAKPAIVYGKFCKRILVGHPSADNGNTAETVIPYNTPEFFPPVDVQLLTESFVFDAERGIVQFSQPIYAETAANAITVPELRLRTACSFRDRTTRALMRHTQQRATPGKRNDTPDKIIREDELFATFVPTYARNFQFAAVTDNLAEVNREAAELLDSALEEFRIEPSASRQFSGIVPIELDGAIQSITFTIDQQGARTIAHRNHDPGSPVNLPLQVRRNLEKDRQARERAAAFGPVKQAEAIKQAGK